MCYTSLSYQSNFPALFSLLYFNMLTFHRTVLHLTAYCLALLLNKDTALCIAPAVTKYFRSRNKYYEQKYCIKKLQIIFRQLVLNDSSESRTSLKKKIPHTGNTRPSRTCVIQEYQFYTMSLSQYHGCCQYHESLSTP